MARNIGPACKQCRREGTKLFLKGERCTSSKCALNRRDFAPGQHGKDARVTPSEYRTQLREKQKARRYYGVLERQFRGYYDEAARVKGVTGTNLLAILERRLDNVVYRMGLAESRREARQLVLHAHFRLNGKKVNIPSIILKPGDVVTVREESLKSTKIKELVDKSEGQITPKWLEKDKKSATAKVIAIPERSDIDFPFEEQLIVELYSK